MEFGVYTFAETTRDPKAGRPSSRAAVALTGSSLKPRKAQCRERALAIGGS